MKSWVQSHLNVGLVVGVILVFLTYLLVVSQQAATSNPGVVVTTVAQWLRDKQLNGGSAGETGDAHYQHSTVPQQHPNGGSAAVAAETQQIADKQPMIQSPSEPETPPTKVMCNMEERLSDFCELDGDVRVNGSGKSVVIVPSRGGGWSSERREWLIQAYSRRGASVPKLTVTQFQGPAAPPCTVTYTVPAIVFALGGYSGNVYHDNADVLLPLFLATRQYDGEVQLLVTNRAQPWWLGKYRLALSRFSKYDVVNLDGDAHVRCFRHLAVGLRLHKDFGVEPEKVPGGRRLTMADYTRFLRETYALPRWAATSPAREPGKRPRLMLIQRQYTRRFVNQDEIVRAAEAAGFEVAVTDLVLDKAVDEQARLVNSFDAIVGLHGAGMTNELFLPPGGVLIQVVPFGKLDLIARIEYGEPAADVGLKYICYNITLAESTLPEKLGPDHPAITDPDAIHREGWGKVFDLYMVKQDVRLDIARFAPALAEAMDHLRRQQ